MLVSSKVVIALKTAASGIEFPHPRKIYSLEAKRLMTNIVYFVAEFLILTNQKFTSNMLPT